MVNESLAVSAARNGDLLVRVDPAAYDKMLQRGAVPAFVGKDRPMGRGWISVPRQCVDDDAELTFWVDVGVDAGNAPT